MEQVLKVTTLLILGLNLITYSPLLANPNPTRGLSSPENLMSQSNNMPVKKVTLTAHEQKLPPLGIPENPNRDIGFASVFIRLENSQTKTVKIRIEKIEIRSTPEGKLQPFTFSPQEIELKPLENSELAFQLSNKNGYTGQDKVKAVVTFKIDNQVKIMESEPVTVQGQL